MDAFFQELLDQWLKKKWKCFFLEAQEGDWEEIADLPDCGPKLDNETYFYSPFHEWEPKTKLPGSVNGAPNKVVSMALLGNPAFTSDYCDMKPESAVKAGVTPPNQMSKPHRWDEPDSMAKYPTILDKASLRSVVNVSLMTQNLKKPTSVPQDKHNSMHVDKHLSAPIDKPDVLTVENPAVQGGSRQVRTDLPSSTALNETYCLTQDESKPASWQKADEPVVEGKSGPPPPHMSGQSSGREMMHQKQERLAWESGHSLLDSQADTEAQNVKRSRSRSRHWSVKR